MTTHNFVDISGHVVLSLEVREKNKIALIGTKSASNNKVQISAPAVENNDGFARIVYGNKIGICRTKKGIEATRSFLVSLHNRQLANVELLHGYLITTLGI